MRYVTASKSRLSCTSFTLRKIQLNAFNLARRIAIGYFLSVASFSATAILSTVAIGQEEDPYQEARTHLIEGVLKPGGIKNKDVLKAIADTPRHEFVPDDIKDQAYADRALPIGESQTISSPYIVAVMTEALQPKLTDKVLEIGTGSGYQAAVLSPLVKSVYTIEIVEDLGQATTALLDRLDYDNVFCKIGDGFQGWKENAPYDKIIVTCSPDKVPVPLVSQLKEGGLMVIPVGPRYQQVLHVLRKKEGKMISEFKRPTLFVPMTGVAEKNRGDKVNVAAPTINNGDFEAPPIGAFIAGWYYEFGAKLAQDPKAPNGNSVVEFTNEKPGAPSMLLQGLPMDGRAVTKIRLSGASQTTNVKPGPTPDDQAMIVIQFLDEDRNQIALSWLGPYSGNRAWKKEKKVFNVPPNSREAILRIGLLGATGTVRFDDIQVEAIGKK